MHSETLSQEQSDFLREHRMRMVEEYLTGDPEEQRLWWMAIMLAGPVLVIVSVAFAAFAMLFGTEKSLMSERPQDIIRIKRIKPPPPPKAIQKPPQIKKIKVVPIPDPTPDEPEPIVPPEEEEVEIPEELQEFDFLGDIPESPPAPDTGPVRIGVNVQGIPPEPIRRIDPIYPEAARRLRIEGVVILEIVVKKDGSVGDVRVLRSLNPLLDQAAIEAAKQWRFKPGRVNNRPVDAYFILTVRFSLSQAG